MEEDLKLHGTRAGGALTRRRRRPGSPSRILAPADASLKEAGQEAVNTHQIATPRQIRAVTITHRGRLGPAWSSAEIEHWQWGHEGESSKISRLQ